MNVFSTEITCNLRRERQEEYGGKEYFLTILPSTSKAVEMFIVWEYLFDVISSVTKATSRILYGKLELLLTGKRKQNQAKVINICKQNLVGQGYNE